MTARVPPIRVVCLRPYLSVKMPATGERAKVAPIVKEPTSAEKIGSSCNFNRRAKMLIAKLVKVYFFMNNFFTAEKSCLPNMGYFTLQSNNEEILIINICIC
jgi:hypothetical protein